MSFNYYKRLKPEGPKWTDHANVLCAIGLIGVAMLQLKVFEKQESIFQGQLKEMQDAGKPAQKSADAAAKFADNAAKIEASIAKASIALNRSVDIATTNVSLSRDQARTEERPWVGVVDITISRDTANDLPSISVELINDGKTPANNVTSASVWVTSKYPLADIDSIAAMSDVADAINRFRPEFKVWRIVTIAPQNKTYINEGTPTDYKTIKGVINRTQALIDYGEIRYEDIFGKEHLTMFCAVIIPTDKGYTYRWYQIGNFME